VCSFHQDEPPPLVTLQQTHWEPLLHWARKTFDVGIDIFDSVLSNQQPEQTKQKFDAVLSDFDHWEMAGM
jgi:ATP synthase F1 complex assembly factor 2